VVYFFLLLTACVVFVEATTEIVVKSDLFRPIRNKILSIQGIPVVSHLLKAFECGHCFSVWAAFIITPVMVLNTLLSKFSAVQSVTLSIVLSLVVHRVSNYLHMFVDRHVDKFYKT